MRRLLGECELTRTAATINPPTHMFALRIKGLPKRGGNASNSPTKASAVRKFEPEVRRLFLIIDLRARPEPLPSLLRDSLPRLLPPPFLKVSPSPRLHPPHQHLGHLPQFWRLPRLRLLHRSLLPLHLITTRMNCSSSTRNCAV